MSISLMPKILVKRTQDINLDELKSLGIKLLIFDIDNTLVARHSVLPEDDIISWLKAAKMHGFEICFMTNNRGKRIAQFRPEPSEFHVCNAMKPFKRNYKKILKHFGVAPHEACMVGDQVFTDILGANRMSMHSVLVDRIQDYGWIGRKLMHCFEDYLRRRFREQVL